MEPTIPNKFLRPMLALLLWCIVLQVVLLCINDFIATKILSFSIVALAVPFVIVLLHSIVNEQWYEKDHAFEDVLNLSAKLVQDYNPKQNNIFGIGQSPAWIVQGATILSPNYKDSFHLIPFSSRILKRVTNSDPSTATFEKIKNFPSQAAIHSYRDYLSKNFLSPQNIRFAFAEDGKKTVILEYSETVEGLASFVSILSSWAKEVNCLEDFCNNMQLVCIRSDDGQSPVTHLKEPATGKSFKINWIEGKPYARFDLHGHDRNAVNMWHFKQDNPAAADRLVPYYPPEKWHERPLLANKPEVLTKIRQGLESAAKNSLLFFSLGVPPTKQDPDQAKPRRRQAVNTFTSAIS